MAKKQRAIEDSLVSMTFSIENKWKEKLRQYATAAGAVRKINNGTSMTGDLSKAIKILLVYGLTHIEEVEKWRSDEVKKVMSGDDNAK